MSVLPAAGLTPFRRRLISGVPPAHDRLAPHPSTAFVWPTEHCSVGCAHCNFSSVPRRGADGPPSMDPEALVRWLLGAGAKRLVLCGGGEPLDEPEFCAAVIARCAREPLDVGIYTAGRSLSAPCPPREYIRQWQSLRGRDPRGRFRLRLSLDAFHTDRLGTRVVADWIEAAEELAPDWKVSLRALRVDHDTSLQQVAGHLGARIRSSPRGSARLVLASGRTLVVERMSFIVDGRGTLDLLRRRGLALPADDTRRLAPWQELVGRSGRLGRPLSRRLTVGAGHVDLEIHADSSVHVLESQPFDARLSWRDHGWEQMRELYYRDPLIHAVACGGLELPASLLRESMELGVADRTLVPYSVERLTDARVLDWITARAVIELADAMAYPAEVVRQARELLRAGAVTEPA